MGAADEPRLRTAQARAPRGAHADAYPAAVAALRVRAARLLPALDVRDLLRFALKNTQRARGRRGAADVDERIESRSATSSGCCRGRRARNPAHHSRSRSVAAPAPPRVAVARIKEIEARVVTGAAVRGHCEVASRLTMRDRGDRSCRVRALCSLRSSHRTRQLPRCALRATTDWRLGVWTNGSRFPAEPCRLAYTSSRISPPARPPSTSCRASY